MARVQLVLKEIGIVDDTYIEYAKGSKRVIIRNDALQDTRNTCLCFISTKGEIYVEGKYENIVTYPKYVYEMLQKYDIEEELYEDIIKSVEPHDERNYVYPWKS